jgi:RNA polymerase sigma factor (sigma-70 family)
MAAGRGALLNSIQRLFQAGPVSGLDERALLERFVARRDEAAFAALVMRHGPLVLGACRRILREPHDVEDAFQATFLILMMRASEVRDPGRLGPWLYGVARRVALRARANAARRREHSVDLTNYPAESVPDTDHRDVLEVIDAEVDRLPARYRAAVVLCDLEGLTYAEAAGRLRCPQGTVQSRLARGRARLRERLTRRGLAPVGLAFPRVGSLPEIVPPALAEATVRTASTVALGRAAAAGAVPAAVAALVHHVARAMTMTRIGTVAASLITISLALGAAFLARGARPVDPPPVTPRQKPAPLAQPGPTRTLDLKVVRADDQAPLPGASVCVLTTTGQEHTYLPRCDEQGHVPLVFPAETTYFVRVVVGHPGFVPIELRWPGSDIPAT